MSEGGDDGRRDGRNDEGDGAPRPVGTAPQRRPPRRATPVFPASRPVLRAGLEIPSADAGLPIGRLAHRGRPIPDERPLTYALPDGEQNPDPAAFTHVLVSGRTGRGKTTMAKNLLRQLLADDCKYKVGSGPAERAVSPAVVVIDPSDDGSYQGLGHPSSADLSTVPDAVATGPADVRTFAPAVDVGNAPAGTPDEWFELPFDLARRTPALLSAQEATQTTRQTLYRCVEVFFEGDNADIVGASQVAPTADERTYDAFRRWLQGHATGTNNALADAIGASRKSIGAVRRRVEAPPVRDLFERRADVPDTDVEPFTDHPADFVTPGRATVVATGHLRDRPAVERGVVQAILSYLARAKLRPSDGPLADTPVVLACDEAHRYLRRRETERSRRVVEQTKQVAREGRSNQFGLLSISQRPSDIDETIRSQVGTQILMALDDQEAKTLGVPRQRRQLLAGFDPGQALVSPPGGGWREFQGFEPLVRHP